MSAQQEHLVEPVVYLVLIPLVLIIAHVQVAIEKLMLVLFQKLAKVKMHSRRVLRRTTSSLYLSTPNTI